MNYILFDSKAHQTLLPLTFTRPVADLRLGILTIREKWEKLLNTKTSSLTEEYLSEKYPAIVGANNILINGSLLPNVQLLGEINNLEIGQSLYANGVLIAAHLDAVNTKNYENASLVRVDTKQEVKLLERPWQIFQWNDWAIREDFSALTGGRTSKTIKPTNTVISPENVFVEEGAYIECSILNASTGPIYIGKDTEVMEGSIIRGPFALCEHASTKMGTRIYGATTIGPHSKVGGEVSNSVIQGYSNKGHDGFLGNSVLGEWCNLGADTNNSNLKNNYSEIKVWDYTTKSYIETGLQFCGLIMGDHAKSAINTMFNTGTVVGVFANVFGAGFPDKFIPSFTWGGGGDISKYRMDEAFEVAERVMSRRGIEFTEADKRILQKISTMDIWYK